MRVRSEHGAKFILGFLLICAAQSLLPQRDYVFLRLNFTPWLQEILHPAVPSLDNAIISIILLCIAGVLIARAVEFTSLASSVSTMFYIENPPRILGFIRQHWLSLVAALLLIIYLLSSLNERDTSPGLVFLWLAALALLVRVLYFYDKAAGTMLSLKLTRVDVLWLVALLAVGLVIGAYQLDSIPNSLIGDEGSFWDRATAIAEGRERRSFFDVGVYSYPLPSSYYQATILQLFGYSLWSWRFSSVLASVLTVIPLYLLAREMFDRRMAVVASMLFIALPYALAFSRMGYNNSQSILPVALAVYLVYLALRRNSILYFGLSGAAAGFGFYTYTAGRLGLAVLVGFMICVVIVQWFARFRRGLPEESRQRATKGLPVLLLACALMALMAWVVIAPHYVHANAVSPELLQYKMLESLFPNTHYALSLYSAEELFRDHPPIRMGDQEFFYRPDLYVRLFTRGVFQTMLSLHETMVVRSHFILAPLAGPVSVVFYFIGFALALRYIRQREFFLILFWFMGGLFLLSMINTFPPRQQHFVPIIPMISLLTAVGLLTFADFAAEKTRTLLAKLPIVGLLKPAAAAPSFVLVGTILGIVTFTNLQNYFVEMPQNYVPDFENIISWEALNLREPVNFAYVYNDDTRADFIPWIIRYIPTQAVYQTVSRSNLQAHDFEFSPGTRYVFYFPEEDLDMIETFLREMSALNPAFRAYRNFEGRHIGSSVSFRLPGSSQRTENRSG